MLQQRHSLPDIGRNLDWALSKTGSGARYKGGDHRSPVALAKSVCRTRDRRYPEGLFGPRGGVGRTAFETHPFRIRRLLQ